jgi:hypothetical protein
MVRRYDLTMSEPVAEQLSKDVQQIVQGTHSTSQPSSSAS